MVPTLEAIKGGGGSIKVGSTGTIASLMNKELESTNHMPRASISSGRKTPTVPVYVPCGAIPRRTQPRKNSPNEASSSSGGQNIPVNAQKMRSSLQKNDHHVPMLCSESIPMERDASNEKPNKKGSSLVEVVDLKCGNPDKVWCSRRKRTSFSKLSETDG
ncbi:hypothetical protein ACLOJK_039508 [Asimina triloba]